MPHHCKVVVHVILCPLERGPAAELGTLGRVAAEVQEGVAAAVAYSIGRAAGPSWGRGREGTSTVQTWGRGREETSSAGTPAAPSYSYVQYSLYSHVKYSNYVVQYKYGTIIDALYPALHGALLQRLLHDVQLGSAEG